MPIVQHQGLKSLQDLKQKIDKQKRLL